MKKEKKEELTDEFTEEIEEDSKFDLEYYDKETLEAISRYIG